MRLQAAVAALALLKGDDRFVQMPLLEVRPECIRDPDLGISNLPEKKIADAEFTAGQDQEIGEFPEITPSFLAKTLAPSVKNSLLILYLHYTSENSLASMGKAITTQPK